MQLKSLKSLSVSTVIAILTATACGGSADPPSEEPQGAAEPAAQERTEVSNANDAQDEVERRGDAREIDDATGQRVDAEIEQVTWEYGNCVDAASLLPPPLEGWGMLNDLPKGEWPITPKAARITYTYADESLAPNSTEYGSSKENISINISSDGANSQGMKDMYANPELSAAMLKPGPYNYPVQNTPAGYPGRTVLLGDYLVQLDGTGKDMDAYFNKIVKCGIDSGLVAEGVDAAQLRDMP